MEDDKLDGLLMTLIQQSNGIEGLLKNFFGFMRRKTDFFANSSNPYPLTPCSKGARCG